MMEPDGVLLVKMKDSDLRERVPAWSTACPELWVVQGIYAPPESPLNLMGLWNVAHRTSGMAVIKHIESLEEARRLAAEFGKWQVDWSLDKWHLLRKVSLGQKAILANREQKYLRAAIERAERHLSRLAQDPVQEQSPSPG